MPSASFHGQSCHEQNSIFVPDAEPSLRIPLKIRKSRRRTWSIALQSEPGSQREPAAVPARETGLLLLMKIPLSLSYQEAERLLHTKESWILKQYHARKKQQEALPVSTLTPAQSAALEMRYRQAARSYFAARVAYYEPIIGVTHTTLTIRDQKTRWGSCSARGGLNFNWRLMLAPPRVLDYVVVHELCHRKEMNHSKAFWHAVEMVLPDYRELRKWLRDNGATLVL